MASDGDSDRVNRVTGEIKSLYRDGQWVYEDDRDRWDADPEFVGLMEQTMQVFKDRAEEKAMGANDLGGVTGHMSGTVIRGEDVERVLAAVPEQTWQWEEDWGFKGGLADIETPMSKRREIVATILGIVARDG